MTLFSTRSMLLRMPAFTTLNESRRGLRESILPKIRRKVIEFTTNRYKPNRVMRLGPELSCLEWLMNCGATSVKMSDGTEILSQKQMSAFVNYYGVDLKKKIELPEAEVVKKYESSMRSSSSADQADNLIYAQRWKHTPPIFIDEVDASDSVIADPGFRYFAECRQIKKLKMSSCDYFGDAAIKELAVSRLSHSLIDLGSQGASTHTLLMGSGSQGLEKLLGAMQEIGINPMMTDTSILWLSEMRSLKRLHLYQLPNVVNRKSVIRQLKISLPKCHVTYPLVEMVGLLHLEHHNPTYTFRDGL